MEKPKRARKRKPDTAKADLGPQDLACPPIQAIDHPAMLILGRIEAITAEVESLLGRLRLVGTDGGSQEDALAPQTGQRYAAAAISAVSQIAMRRCSTSELLKGIRLLCRTCAR